MSDRQPSPGAVRAAEEIAAHGLLLSRSAMAEIIERRAVSPERTEAIMARAARDAEQSLSDTLAAALAKCERVNTLRDELSECYARMNGAGRTTTAESITVSKARVQEIRAEIKDAVDSARAALKAHGGE